MSNFFKDNPDLQFYLEEGIDWESLVAATEHDYRAREAFPSARDAVAFYREIAEMVGEFVAEEVAPHTAEIDRHGARLVDGEVVMPERFQAIFEQIKALDLHGMCLPRELGGLNVPALLYFVNAEMFARADVSLMTHYSFHGGIAMAMLMFSLIEGTTTLDPERAEVISTRFRKEIEDIARGRAWGCMDITEPDAGSDMAALRAVGEQDADGAWYVSGQKIFITSGHGKYHFVIARTEKTTAGADHARAGLGGLSMFLVPAYIDNADGTRTRIATIERIEEKLGHHGSVTATMSFDRAPAQLLGKRGEGFKYMLYLMNNARLGVGFESIGLCESAYRMARDYAAGRPAMGKTIDRHELIADYLDEMETDIVGLRALAMYGAFHEEMGTRLHLYGGRDGDLDRARQARRHQARARRVTPLLKYLAAEKAVEMARRCLQIHGGNGYTTEYGAEKLLRDSIVMPIYEGTSQIQSLMAMKDTLSGIMKNPQAFVKRLAQTRWQALSARDPLERRVARIEQLSLMAQQHLITRTATDKLRTLSSTPLPEWPRSFRQKWDPKRDFAFAMVHAERLTRLLADAAICRILRDQSRRHPARRALLESYLDRAEPRCRFLHDEITTTGRRVLSRLAAREAAESEQQAQPRAAG